jgi:prepilin-type N-terminal cleavage/methylation domain-containing protein
MRQGRRCGVTLIELLVVVAIIGVLVALLLPAVQSAREAARRSRCQNNLHQIGTALHVYHGAQRHFPVGCIEKRVPVTKPAGRQLAWSATLLPQLEEESLWQQVDFTSAYDSADNANAAVVIVATFLCPSTTRMAAGRDGAIVANTISTSASTAYRGAAIDYGGIYGAAQVAPSANGVFLYDRAVKIADITDGTSHTLAVAEDSGRGWLMNGEWINGENVYDVGGQINKLQDNEIWSDHPGGAMALSCDGSVAFLDESIDLAALRSLCTRAGNESVDTAK